MMSCVPLSTACASLAPLEIIIILIPLWDSEVLGEDLNRNGLLGGPKVEERPGLRDKALRFIDLFSVIISTRDYINVGV
jgi:hypothetical protein